MAREGLRENICDVDIRVAALVGRDGELRGTGRRAVAVEDAEVELSSRWIVRDAIVVVVLEARVGIDESSGFLRFRRGELPPVDALLATRQRDNSRAQKCLTTPSCSPKSG